MKNRNRSSAVDTASFFGLRCWQQFPAIPVRVILAFRVRRVKSKLRGTLSGWMEPPSSLHHKQSNIRVFSLWPRTWSSFSGTDTRHLKSPPNLAMASAAAAAASGAGIGSYGQGKFIQDANGRFFLLSPAGKVVPAENAMQTLASPTFGAYMRSAVPSPFPFKGLIAVEVKVSIWNGRKLTIFHGENASKATVSGRSLRTRCRVGRSGRL